MTYTVLITGTNRGIGLEFVRQYADMGWHVLACCRDPKKAIALNKLAEKNASIEIHALEVTDFKQIQDLSLKLKGKSIDLLINNAGIYGGPHQDFGNFSVEVLEQIYLVNTIAPLKITEAFVEQLANSKLKKVVTISSHLGSISNITYTEFLGYNCSKAAVNMGMKCLSLDLAKKDIKVLILSPGWVKTDMGGPNAEIDVQTSVTGMIKVISKEPSTTDKLFFYYTGVEIPW